MKTLENRFWAKVNTRRGSNSCWLWEGSLNTDGYGNIGVGGKTKGAHRVCYELYIGEIPKKMCVCHKCDTPACVNPKHLFLGTVQDNIQDMINKNRKGCGKGEKQHKAKLNNKKVLEIRAKFKAGEHNYKKLAEEYKVTMPTVNKVILKRTWKHVKEGVK